MVKTGIILSDKERRTIVYFVLTSYVISTIINIICIASIATFFVCNHINNAEKVLVPIEVLEIVD